MRKPSISSYLTATGVFFLLLESGCSRSAQYYFERGVASSAAGNAAEAILDFRKALQKDPRFGPAYLALGKAYRQESNRLEAYAAFRQAVALLPDSEEAKIQFADSCLDIYVLDRSRPKLVYDQLNALANQLIAKNPNSFEALRLKGNVAMLDRRPDLAIELLRKADGIKPMQSGVILPLAESLFASGQSADAEQLVLQFVEKETSFPGAYDLLYAFYSREGRAGEAEKILQRKVQNFPNLAGPRLQLAAHYARAKQHNDMDKTLQGLLRSPGQFPGARLQVGDFYVEAASPAQAMAIYQEGLQSDPSSKATYRKRIVNLLMVEHKQDEATRMVDLALKDTPGDEELKTARAMLLAGSGKPEKLNEALTIFSDLAKQRPEDLSRRVNYGRAALLKGDLVTAKSEFVAALKLNTNSIPIQALLTDTSLRKREYAEALQYADALLKDAPGNPGVHLMRSASLIGLGRFAEVHKELEAILAVQPKSVDAKLQLGTVDLAEGHATEAEVIFRTTYERTVGDIRPLEGIVAARMAQSHSDSAIRIVSQELEKAPDSATLRGLLARTALLAGSPDLAIEQFKILAAKNPQSADAHLQLGGAMNAKREFAAALAQFELARSLTPTDPRPQIAIAITQVLMDRKDAARESYRKALSMQPANPFLMNDLAYLILQTGGDAQEAQRLVQDALKRQPEQPNFMDTLGSIYLKNGQTDSALHIFRMLVARRPGEPSFQYHLAVGLERKGDRGKAREALTAALSQKPAAGLESEIRQLLLKVSP